MLSDNCKLFWIIVLMLPSTILVRVFKLTKVTTIQTFNNRNNVGQPISVISASALSCATHLMQYGGPYTCMKYYAKEGICRSNNGQATVESLNSNIIAGWTFFNIESVGDSIKECKMTDAGKEYRGNANITLKGILCQSWGVNSPHIVDFNVYNVLGQEEDHAIYTTNHCRNPDVTPGGPWCYTMDPAQRWDFCDVPWCRCYN